MQPATVNSALSMPVLTQETESHTVVLNAIPDDIHNDTISILSPGGQNYVEVPILHCQDEEIPPQSDKIPQSASQNDVNSENDTVCVWSQNLNTSTQLTIFSPPPENVVSLPSSEMKAVDSDSVQKTKQSQWGKKKSGICEKNEVPKNEKRKSSKKKLNLERADADNIEPPVSPARSVPVENIGPVESLVIQNTSQDFFCCPGEVFTAEPLHVRAPQKKVFIKSLNFGPNASNTVGNLMPSRKVAKGSALAPFPKKKSSEFTSTVSVNLTKDIKYRKIMPKPAASLAVNIQSASQSVENIIPTEKGNVDDVLIVGDSLNDHYDSDTLSCGTMSPVKFRKVSCKSSDQANSKSDVSKGKATSDLKGSAKESKVSKALNSHKIEAVDEEKYSHSGRNSQKHKGNKIKWESGKPMKVSEENIGEDNTCKNVKNSKHGGDLAVEKNSSKVALNKDKAEARKRNVKNSADSKSLKDDSLARSKGNSGKLSKLKDDGLKGTKKKNEKQLKVKIGSYVGKTQSEKNTKTPKLNRNVNKVFTKSPVTDTVTNKQVLSDRIDVDSVDSDEDIPLKVLKDGLNRSKENHNTDKGSHKISNEADIVSSSVTKAMKGKHEPKVLVVDICPSTPNKRTEKSPGECTPSKEQVLEKLGLTPQKNAKDILENMQMQSPSRTNIIDLLVQLTPTSSDKSPNRRKRILSRQKTDVLQSPDRSKKTPAKRLFGSPSAKKNPGINDKKMDQIPANTKETKSVKGNHESVSKANLSSLVPNGECVLSSVSVIEKVKALDIIGKCTEKHKAVIKENEKVTRKGSTVKEVSVEKLQKELRKVTPLRIKDLYKNTKVAVDRNKESKVGKKRPRDSSDQESEMEVNLPL